MIKMFLQGCGKGRALFFAKKSPTDVSAGQNFCQKIP